MAVICGHVYHLFLPIAGKPKLLVPAYIAEDDRVRFFLINTNRTAFQEINPERTKLVLPLRQQDNAKFLTRDCWLCCDEPIGGWKAAAIERIKNCYRGPLDKATTAAVRVVITESRTYSDPEKAEILDAWPK